MNIKVENEEHLKWAKRQLSKFEAEIARTEAYLGSTDMDEVVKAAYLAGMRSVAKDLEDEIKRYERTNKETVSKDC